MLSEPTGRLQEAHQGSFPLYPKKRRASFHLLGGQCMPAGTRRQVTRRRGRLPCSLCCESSFLDEECHGRRCQQKQHDVGSYAATIDDRKWTSNEGYLGAHHWPNGRRHAWSTRRSSARRGGTRAVLAPEMHTCWILATPTHLGSRRYARPPQWRVVSRTPMRG